MNYEDSQNSEGISGHERSERIAYLVAGYLEDDLSVSEKRELDDWLKESESNQRIFRDLTDLKKIEARLKFADRLNKKAAWDQVTKGITTKQKRSILSGRYAAAAVVLVVLGMALILILKIDSFKSEKPVVFHPAPGVTIPGDIGPGANKATLQIDDGHIVMLSDSATQVINSDVTNVEGQLLYAEQVDASVTAWHLLSTPRGGEYMIRLPDETRVWLNAASSLRYPTSFTGVERRVELTGEAYFEVKHNAQKPFIVQLSDKNEVRVLGTHFNINAYADEPVVKTTLLEGKVSVNLRGDEHGLTIKPGQQAIIHPNGKITSINLANVSAEAAWQKGNFEFIDADIESVMRSIERWYDAEIIYQSKPGSLFNAEVSRHVPVSKLLEFLQATKRVHFEIVGKKIIVSN